MKIAIVLTLLAGMAMSHPMVPQDSGMSHAHLSSSGTDVYHAPPPPPQQHQQSKATLSNDYHQQQHQQHQQSKATLTNDHYQQQQYQSQATLNVGGDHHQQQHHQQQHHPEPNHQVSGGCAYGDDMVKVGHEINLLCENGDGTYKAVCESSGAWNVMTEMCTKTMPAPTTTQAPTQAYNPFHYVPTPAPHHPIKPVAAPHHSSYPHGSQHPTQTFSGHQANTAHHQQHEGGPYKKPMQGMGGIMQMLLLQKFMGGKDNKLSEIVKILPFLGPGGFGNLFPGMQGPGGASSGPGGFGNLFPGMQGPSGPSSGPGSIMSVLANPMFASILGGDNPDDSPFSDLFKYSGFMGGDNPMAALMGGNPMAALMGGDSMSDFYKDNPMALYSQIMG